MSFGILDMSTEPSDRTAASGTVPAVSAGVGSGRVAAKARPPKPSTKPKMTRKVAAEGPCLRRCIVASQSPGVAEIAAMLGLSRQRVNQLIQSPDFPAPEAELSAGRIWSREAVETWVA